MATLGFGAGEGPPLDQRRSDRSEFFAACLLFWARHKSCVFKNFTQVQHVAGIFWVEPEVTWRSLALACHHRSALQCPLESDPPQDRSSILIGILPVFSSWMFFAFLIIGFSRSLKFEKQFFIFRFLIPSFSASRWVQDLGAVLEFCVN